MYAWCYLRKPKGYGLTIPFIAGVSEDLTLEVLLTEIRDSQYKEKIILQYCNDRKEYIISMDDPMYPLSNKLKGFGNLLINDETLEDFLSFEQLTEFLAKEYLHIINNGTYSKNMETNEWEPYSHSDLEFIDQALQVR